MTFRDLARFLTGSALFLFAVVVGANDAPRSSIQVSKAFAAGDVVHSKDDALTAVGASTGSTSKETINSATPPAGTDYVGAYAKSSADKVTPTGSSGCSEVEPNNTIGFADPITLGIPCNGAAGFTDSSTYVIFYPTGPDGKVHDVFRLTTGSSGTVTVTMTFTNASADLDIVLFSQVSGSTVDRIAGSTGFTTTETFTTPTLAAGTYYVGVSAYSASGGSSAYTVLATAGSSGGVPAAPSNLTATGTSTSQIRLNWQDNSNNENEFHVEQRGTGGTFVDIGAAPPNATTINVNGLSAGQTGTFRIRARNGSTYSLYSNEATGTSLGSFGPCVANSTTVCLLSDRFKVRVNFKNQFSNPPGATGDFLTARLLQGVQNPDTGLFGFASAQAVEVVVRIQDTRPFAPRFDVYYGGMTDVEYFVNVTDTVTGVTRQYRNLPGVVGGGVDRESFPAN